MLVLRIDLKQFRDTLGRVAVATENVVKRQSAAAEEAAQLSLQALKRFCPVGQHWTPDGRPFSTEELKNSLRISSRRMIPVKSLKATGRWFGQQIDISMLARGRFTLEGAKAREIYPSGKALHFFWDGRKYPPRVGMPASARFRLARTMRNVSEAGAEVWLAHVNWPGYPGHRWDIDAYTSVQAQVHELLKRVAMQYVVELKGIE